MEAVHVAFYESSNDSPARRACIDGERDGHVPDMAVNLEACCSMSMPTFPLSILVCNLWTEELFFEVRMRTESNAFKGEEIGEVFV